MHVLVIGANGLVGSSLVRTCLDRSIDVSGTYHTERPAFDVDLFKLDIRDSEQVREIVEQVEPDSVVNCAAYTDVDGCEENPDLARTVNGDAPGYLAGVCAELGISFVHLSTDYVFDGEAEEPYAENDEPNPVQVYGKTKLTGEQQVLDADPDAIVCRLSFVWGRHGATGELEGFPAWVLARAREGQSVPAFTDQYVTPTRAEYAADVVLALLEEDVDGIFHVASRDCVTPYEFGKALIESSGLADPGLVEEGSLDDVDRPAPRPVYTCLTTTLARTLTSRDRPVLTDEISAALD
ncbi:dTDP-4-dehydrorhamnose reductase [Natronoarchaeum sp. GCM10025703]|uniref:dTDP-4-dehydrorhamnose reductase n=1 Tax=unclassified Natronoarchaeum TaxID=2620183 RepID=UPI003605C053